MVAGAGAGAGFAVAHGSAMMDLVDGTARRAAPEESLTETLGMDGPGRRLDVGAGGTSAKQPSKSQPCQRGNRSASGGQSQT